MMFERTLGAAGLAVFLAFAGAGAVARVHATPAAPANTAAGAAVHAGIADGDVVVGRPHDGAFIERALRAWSRHVHRRGRGLRVASGRWR